jgi:uncharacterized protein (DUF1015 family)
VTEFKPFKGILYNSDKVSLADVIAPPYDVVNADDRQHLCQKSPYNCIRIELPDKSLLPGIDPYLQAAKEFDSWQAEDILVRDNLPSFYIYRMTFKSHDENGTLSTTGVIGALGLDKSAKDVLPHEQTMPKPKGDRLDLLRAAKANTSPIWVLSLAEGLAKLCQLVTENDVPIESATDENETLHELWTVSDSAQIKEIENLITSTPLIIADGHHRYETALHYQAERTDSDSTADREAYDYLMAFAVELTEDELVVNAIHRLLTELPTDFDILAALESNFDLTPGPESAIDLEKQLVSKESLGLITKSGNYFLKPHMTLLQKDQTGLDSARLDIALEQFPTHNLTYQHGAMNIYKSVRDDNAQFGILLRPATVSQIADTAHSAKRMPPKTTFFHPKPRTGMVFRSLED